MKMSDGLFLDSCREVSKKYPSIPYEEIIVDNCMMQLVSRPQRFDVMVTPNFYGSLVSNGKWRVVLSCDVSGLSLSLSLWCFAACCSRGGPHARPGNSSRCEHRHRRRDLRAGHAARGHGYCWQG
jgi:hypothetical protein